MTILTSQKQIADASAKDLVATYNALTGKNIKKFSSVAAGRTQVANAILAAEDRAAHAGVKKDEKPVAAPLEKKAPAPAAKKTTSRDASASTAASWKDPETHAARSRKDRVTANGTEYKSVAAAFRALKLPLTKVIPFRLSLKAARKAAFDGHKFTIVGG